MTLPDLFDLSLSGQSGEPALHWRDKVYSFGEIGSRAARMASLLEARGLKAGDRLCVYLPNCLESIDLFLAATRLGVILVPVNILYRDREIRHIVSDAEPAAIVSAPEFEAILPPLTSIWRAGDLAREAEAAEPSRTRITDPDAPAAIVYTSGTTGASKGAVLSHNVFAVNAVNIASCWRMTSADRLLLTLPLFHVHGLGNGICSWLLSGCRLMLTERFDHTQAEKWFLEFKPTVFFGVPTMYARLLETARETASRIGSGMRLFVCGSAPLPAQVLEDFRSLFGHTILERYGMSETLMNISNPYAGERRPGSVGLPLPGVSAQIVDAEFRPVPDGTPGELLLRGSNVFSGYWRRPDATREAFHDGWFRTGDIAVRSADGYYTLQGRRSDLIISGGFNIYPREIEELLAEQPEVAEAAVAGRPDRLRGEVPVAYVVPAPGCRVDPAALEAACRAHLASFKVPRAFIEVEKLPRTALGKVQKHLLPAWPQPE